MTTTVKGYIAGGPRSDFDAPDEHGVGGPALHDEFFADGQEWVVTARTPRDDGGVDIVASCIGCHHCEIAGVRWPAQSGGDGSEAWVERCDYCRTFPSDEAAAAHVAAEVGGTVAYGETFDGREQPYVTDPRGREAAAS